MTVRAWTHGRRRCLCRCSALPRPHRSVITTRIVRTCRWASLPGTHTYQPLLEAPCHWRVYSVSACASAHRAPLCPLLLRCSSSTPDCFVRLSTPWRLCARAAPQWPCAPRTCWCSAWRESRPQNCRSVGHACQGRGMRIRFRWAASVCRLPAPPCFDSPSPPSSPLHIAPFFCASAV